MIRKDVMLAVLATFCLAVTLFSLAPVRSSQPYNPWADIDDNGKIDMKDIGNVAARFMTSGDSTKPVEVSAYNWTQNLYTIVLGPQQEGNVSFATAGYREVTLGFKASPSEIPPIDNVSVATGFLMGTSLYVSVDRFNATPGWTGNEPPILSEYPVVKTYDIHGQTLIIAYYNPNPVTCTLWIEYYMTT